MNSPALLFRAFVWTRAHVLAAALLLPSALIAQSATTGRIAGRIFNPATQEYVRNAEVTVEGSDIVAFSGDDGSYLLSNVPSGEVRVSISYTGYERETATVTLAPGQTATRDFDLKGSTFRPGTRAAPAAGEIVKLEKFVVSNEREGNAKAIMEQRAALNMKNVVASDNFGDITGGNPGEFMKYLPGVVIDYNNADARSVRIGGLDPKYAAVNVDGMRLASAASATFGGTTRQFEFEQASITSVESIELNKTLTASMDADAPAGTLNLRSKNAFDRKGREVTAMVSVTGNPSYDFTWKRTPSPGDGAHRKIRPGAVLTYSESFRQRFGIQVSLSANQLYNEQAGLTHTFDNTNATRGPVINALQFRDNPKITTRAAFGLNTDFRITPELVFSLRTSASHFRDEINARTITFRAATAQIDPSSTLTHLLANPTANTNTRLESAIGHSDKWNDTVAYTPKLEWKHNDTLVTLAGGYSRSTTHYEDRRSGYWANTANWITRMSWRAERSSPTSTDWQLARVSGRDWTDLANYNRDDPNPNNVSTAERNGRSQIWNGAIDARQTLHLGLPITVAAGLKSRLTVYDLWKTGSLTWTYIGPARSQTDPSTVMIAHAEPHLFDAKQGDNIDDIDIPIPNATAMYDLYREHPEYFQENAVANFTTLYASPRAAKEQIDAGYVELNTRWQRLRLNLGLRHERTRTVGRNFDLVPNADVRAAGYTAGTIPYITYQYRGFQKSSKYGGYDNNFFSGGAKYSLGRNLVLQLSGSQAIGRPDYNNLAGAITIDDTNQRIRVPNPELKPETSNKYFASVQYYIEPAGTLNVSTYQLNIKNGGLGLEEITADEAGYADEPAYAGYTFTRTSNAIGSREIRGVEVEYSQQLVFLPGWMRGFSVFGSVSRAASDTVVTNIVPKAANGGIRFSNYKFNVQLRSTWSAARLTSTNATQRQWDYERLMFDLSGGFKLGQRYEVTLSGRNITNTPIRGYINEPGLLRTNQKFGAVWTLGVRGRW